MKTAGLLVIAVALLCSTGCSASNHDFYSVISGVEQRYAVHAERIPLMGFVSLCARVKTHGGVRDMRVAEFDHIGKLDAGDLYSLMQSKLGAQWQPMVTERSAAQSKMSVIFVEPSDQSMRMLVADYENGELNVVRMELNGSALATWMHTPQTHLDLLHGGNSHPAQTD